MAGRPAAKVAGLLAVLGVSGCAGFTPSIRPNERFDPASAYVYGRFHIERADGAKPDDQSMGFAIECDDGNTYTIPFSSARSLQMLRLKPAVCQIQHIVYTDANGALLGRSAPSYYLLRIEKLVAGGVYYVGDFSAETTHRASWNLLYTEHHWTWRIDEVDDNYAETTAFMKRAFAGFASVRTEDRMSNWKPD